MSELQILKAVIRRLEAEKAARPEGVDVPWAVDRCLEFIHDEVLKQLGLTHTTEERV